MKLPLSLIKTYVDIDRPIEQVAETLTLLGIEVDAVLEDDVLELSLTPNLGHCMSALGIARELAAAWQRPLLQKTHRLVEDKTMSLLQVTAECPRYTARVIESVRIGPSPAWLQTALRHMGHKSINNVVDVTNYMLWKTGQPMHAFDLALVAGKEIHVRPAPKAFEFAGLNGMTVQVPAGALCIWDKEKPIALAGILGGANSCVSDSTTAIVLEAACFDPMSVRKTAKATGLRTDSSQRFEKGVDPSTTAQFLDEAAELIGEIAGGKVSARIETGQAVPKPKIIPLRPARVNQVLGLKLSENEIIEILHRLHMRSTPHGIEVPLYRADITEEIDLVEEVARIYGYNHIPRPLPRITTSQLAHDPEYLFENKLRSRLVSLGLQEFLTCDLISPKLASLTGTQELLQAKYSKSEEYSVLRPSLLPGLLQATARNLAQKNETLRAFELGRVHVSKQEIPMVAVLCTGNKEPAHWGAKSVPTDFFELKGFIESLFQTLRVSNVGFIPSSSLLLHPSRQAEVCAGKTVVGTVGQVHPNCLQQFGIDQPVYYAELNAQLLRNLVGPPAKMSPLAQFPASERDWTVSLPPRMHIEALLQAIRAVECPLLEQCALIDLYTADNKRNATLRFVYRDKNKTVSFDEVEKAHALVIQAAAHFSACKN